MPGHWEGNLVFGRGTSPVATLVERSTRYLMLVGLPDGHRAELVADLGPGQRDGRAHEVHRRHRRRGLLLRSQESLAARQQRNTNGLLRQYLPRTVSMRDYTQADLNDIAAELNGRPRQTLGFKTPSEALNEALR